MPHLPQAGRRFWRWAGLAAGLLALNVTVFWPGLQGDFVWDDDLLLLDHPNYRRPELIVSSLRSLFIISPSYFRPLGYFSFFADYSLFGPRPFWYHAENLLLHCASTLLVARLAVVLGGSFWAAGAAAALFAIHPSRVEGVVFISSRFDLLAALFFLIALLVHRRSFLGHSWAWRWCAAAVYGMALASKEMAVTLPAVAWYADRHLWAPARGATDSRRVPWRSPATYLPYVAALGFYLILRRLVLGSLVVSRELSIPLHSSLEHALLVGKTIAGYVLFTLVPFAPRPVHYTAGIGATDLHGWIGLVLVMAVVWAWLTRHLRGALRDAVLLFFLLLVPVMNIVPIRLAGPSYMAERFLYLPLLAVAIGVRTLPWRRVGLRGLFALLVLSWAVVGRHASAQWADDETLFSWVVRRTPESALGFTNLSLEQTRGGGSPHLAVALGESALARDHLNPDAWDNVGVAYYQMGMLAQAESCFAQALRLAPGHPLFSSNLAGTWRTMGRFPEALQLLGQIIARDSTASSAYLNVGLCYLRMGSPDSAIGPLQRAAVLMDIDTTTWMTLAQALALAGREDEAVRTVANAVRLGLAPSDAGRQLATWGREALHERRVGDAARLLRLAGRTLPDDATIANDTGVALRSLGELASAESSFSRAAVLAPDLALAWANLGEVLALRGQHQAADSVLRQTMTRWPDLADAYRHLGRLKWSQGRHDTARIMFGEYLRRAPDGIFAEEAKGMLRGE